jgi:hypothetical protein
VGPAPARVTATCDGVVYWAKPQAKGEAGSAPAFAVAPPSDGYSICAFEPDVGLAFACARTLHSDCDALVAGLDHSLLQPNRLRRSMPGALLAEEAAVIDRLNMIPLWTVLAVLGVCLSSHNAGATDPPDPDSLVLEACTVDLTEFGRRASWRGTAIYEITSDSTGAVQQIRELRIPEFMPKIVKLDEFKCCVRRWRIHPAQLCTVALDGGSGIGEWSIRFSCEGQPSLKLMLPKFSVGCDEDDAQ